MATSVKHNFRHLMAEQMYTAFNNAKYMFFVSLNGLDANVTVDLRKRLRRLNTSCFVIKKSIANIVFKKLSLDIEEYLGESACAVVLSEHDNNVVDIARVLFEFKKEANVFEVKGGFVEGAVLTKTEVKEVSELPSFEGLIAKFMGCINAPLSRFILVSKGAIQKFVLIINELANRKQDSE